MNEDIEEIKALTKELKALKKEVKDICADLVSFSEELATVFADDELRLLCENLREISEGALRTVVSVRKEAFLAYKEHKLSQARKDEH
jgi:archaellum component FlaC